ncbi:hypothetical protein R1T16_00390 [Flavobacterium sp. DG1-102-2]|uniref:hypothetical protein n=1 Tax=Flavobacterium sp. DG1-102-2 TaxID=3081663 RepID=UPI002949103E|nr:hypothetical protein [Flavobacterium sp. DG1-102-2]MDV6166862.1 hypothetical protein [Flavobacterium sp. DG1-102-2]
MVYVPYKKPIVLTLKDQPNIKLKDFPKFSRVIISDFSFMLATEDKKAYYFTTDGYEQNQTLELMKNFGDEVIKVEKGSTFTQNEVDVPLEKLKAATSVYDVLGK